MQFNNHINCGTTLSFLINSFCLFQTDPNYKRTYQILQGVRRYLHETMIQTIIQKHGVIYIEQNPHVLDIYWSNVKLSTDIDEILVELLIFRDTYVNLMPDYIYDRLLSC